MLALAHSIAEDGILYTMGFVDWAIHLMTALEQDKKFNINILAPDFAMYTILSNLNLTNFKFAKFAKVFSADGHFLTRFSGQQEIDM